MRTIIIDDILRRLDERAPTRLEIAQRRASRRRVEQLVCAIAEPERRRDGTLRIRERQFG